MISKQSLIILNLLYLYVLNLFTVHSGTNIWMMLWAGLVLLILLSIFSILHQLLLKIILTLLVLLASSSVFFKWKYGVVITEDIMLSGFINDFSLSNEIISTHFIVWFFFTGVIPAALILRRQIFHQTVRIQILLSTVTIVISLVFVGLIFIAQGYEIRNKGEIRDPRISQSINYFSPIDTLYGLKLAQKALTNLKRNYSNVEKMSETYNYNIEIDDLLVILVLGETSRGDHFLINGYSRNTNPKLSKIGQGLFSFSNAVSCDTLTILSLRCLVSPMRKKEIGRSVSQSSFGEVMTSLGYSIDIYALQTLSDFYRYLDYSHLVSKYSVLKNSDIGAKDASLLPISIDAIKKYNKGKKLIILHTLGSHHSYNDRLLEEHRVFQPSCKKADVSSCTQEELINAYDNTIVAVDSFLSTLINKLSDKKAMLIYVSDHGESLGEKGHYFHGSQILDAPKEQLSIPFIFWLSNSFQETAQGNLFKERLTRIGKDTPLSHDNVFHSILGCSGITSNNGGIDKKLNLCAETEE